MIHIEHNATELSGVNELGFNEPAGQQKMHQESNSPYSGLSLERNEARLNGVCFDLPQKVKPCIVLLQRTLEAEAAWKRELVNRHKERISRLSSSSAEAACMVQKRGKADFLCNGCGQGFAGRTPYMQHLRACSPAPPGACALCHKILSSPQKLRDHLRFVHGQSEEQLDVACTLCGKKCRSRASLERHALLRHARALVCDVCKEQFHSKVQLKQHLFRCHVAEASDAADAPRIVVYSCPHCHTLHANKDRFKKHLGFIMPASFSAHVVSVEPRRLAKQKQPVKCHVCGTRAANLAFLHTHQSGHAEITRPFPCTRCGRKFIFRCQLDRHSLIHEVGGQLRGDSADRKMVFKCSLCCKRTRSHTKLRSHVTNCHQAALEFRCKVCDTCFSSTKTLDRHCIKKKHPRDLAWIEPPPTCVLSPVAPVATPHDMQPESLCSSDSVSTSDAFSMYFKSLSALDMDCELTEFCADACFPTDSGHAQLLHGRPAVTQVVAHNYDPDTSHEPQFHTLQTIPVLPRSPSPQGFASPEPEMVATSTCILILNPQPLNVLTQVVVPGTASKGATGAAQNPAQGVWDKKTVQKPRVMPGEESSVNSDSRTCDSIDLVIDSVVKNESINGLSDLQCVDSSSEELVVRVPEHTYSSSRTLSQCNIAEKSFICSNPLVQSGVSEQTLGTSSLSKVPKETFSCGGSTDNVPEHSYNNGLCSTVPKDVPEHTYNNGLCSAAPIDVPEQILNNGVCSTVPSDATEQLRSETEHRSKGSKPGSCKDCGKVFSSAHSASRHARRSCPGRAQPELDAFCARCDLKFTNRKELLKHKKQAHPESMFACVACGKAFLLAQSLARHQKESCSLRESFVCKACKATFTCGAALSEHVAASHPAACACHVCGKSLCSDVSLRRHLLRSHKLPRKERSHSKLDDVFLVKNGALQCDFCDAAFASDELLLRHMSSQHFPNTQWQPSLPAASAPLKTNPL